MACLDSENMRRDFVWAIAFRSSLTTSAPPSIFTTASWAFVTIGSRPCGRSRRAAGSSDLDRSRPGPVASAGLRGVDGHAARGPHVDSDRGKDPVGADAAGEPLVELESDGDAARLDDAPDPFRKRRVPGRLRFR